MVPYKSARCYSHSLPLGGWSGGSWGSPGEQRSVKCLSASADSSIQKPHYIVNYAFLPFLPLRKLSVEVSLLRLTRTNLMCCVGKKEGCGCGGPGHRDLYLMMQTGWLQGKYSINLFLIPTLFSCAGLAASPPATAWRRHCGQSSRTARWNSTHPFPLFLALHPSPLLLTVLHKHRREDTKSRGPRFCQKKLSQVYILRK